MTAPKKSARPKKTAPAAPTACRAALAVGGKSAAASLATFTHRMVASASAWRESYNPLRGLNMPRAVAMFEAAQRGLYADLQWTYAAPDAGVEASDPDIMIILERTLSGVTECSWQVKTVSDETRGFDKTLAQEQEAALRENYERCRNLKAAWEHFTLARFRGFAHLNPWRTPDGLLEKFEILPQYAMVRQTGAANWAWNPALTQTPYESLPLSARLDPSDYMLMQSPRPVNRIGLINFIRKNTDEKDWDAFIEAYGLLSCFIVMPANLEEDQRQFWMDAAEDAASGGNGVLPNGADVKSPSAEIRGVQPFQPRLQYLRELVVLVGTGGLLNGLAVSGSGTLAGSVHAQAFREIVRRQAALISEKFQSEEDAPFLSDRFPGRPQLVYFEIEAARERDTTGTVQNVRDLASVGYYTDPKQVEEETGYRIVLFEPPAAQSVDPFSSAASQFAPAPAAPATKPDQAAPEAAAASADNVASTALNGAQITAMVDLLQQAATKQIPLDSLMPILRAAFPTVEEDTLQEITSPLKSFAVPIAPEAARRLVIRAMRRAGIVRSDRTFVLRAMRRAGVPDAGDQSATVAAAAKPQAVEALANDLAPLRAVFEKALQASDSDLAAALKTAETDIPGTLPDAGDGELEQVLEGTMTASLLNAANQTAEEAGLWDK